MNQITSKDPQEDAEMSATTFTERRELAHRTSDGIEVTLFWSNATNQVTIAVLDSHTDERLEFDVDGHAALDAFIHPYAYAATTHARNLAVSQVRESGLTIGADPS
jgi:hypothetical protein